MNLLVQSFPSAVRETLNVAHRELSREFKNDLCLLAEGGVTGQEGRSEGHTDGEREMQDPASVPRRSGFYSVYFYAWIPLRRTEESTRSSSLCPILAVLGRCRHLIEPH